MFYCNSCSANGNNGRVRRNAYYYANPDNKYHWCMACYNAIKTDVVELPDGSKIKKDTLTKRKHDKVVEEEWVQCDRCERWVHQICALFNGRKDDHGGKQSRYYCPDCILHCMKKRESDDPISKPCLGAKDLPRSHLGDHIEKRINELLEGYEKQNAAAIAAKPSLATTKTIGKDGKPNYGVSIRTVSVKDTEMLVRSGFQQRYSTSHKYPQEVPYRQKCLLMFQTLDAVDVLIFGMYVQEYGSDAPPPNTRQIYISYLDSVQYFKPRHLRTKVYHEVIVAYMEHAKTRGFMAGFIWACPPLKGDDYILYCHPDEQKTPKADRLRAWYHTMLDRSKVLGVVHSTTTLWSDFFGERIDNPDKLEDEKDGKEKADKKGKKNAKKAPSSSGGSKKGAKGGAKKGVKGVADQAEAAKDAEETKEETKKETKAPSKKKGKKGGGGNKAETKKGKKKDEKKGATPKSKKDDKKEAKEIVTRQDTCAARIPNFDGDYWPGLAEESIAEMQTQLKDGDGGEGKDGGGGAAGGGASSGASSSGGSSTRRKTKRTRRDLDADQWEVRAGQRDQVMTKLASNIHSMKEDFIVVNLKPRCYACERYILNGLWWHCQECKAHNFDFALCAHCHAKEVVKPDKQKHPSRVPAEKHKLTQMPEMHTPAETKDPDPEVVDSDFFDTRVTFLSLCQGNHYQFDQFRRAKHSSMMVLYHLHNPDAPSFTHTCNECQTTIQSGVRYTCDECKDFDMCENCKRTKSHPHKLTKVNDSASQSGVSQAEMRRRRAQVSQP